MECDTRVPQIDCPEDIITYSDVDCVYTNEEFMKHMTEEMKRLREENEKLQEQLRMVTGSN